MRKQLGSTPACWRVITDADKEASTNWRPLSRWFLTEFSKSTCLLASK